MRIIIFISLITTTFIGSAAGRNSINGVLPLLQKNTGGIQNTKTYNSFTAPLAFIENRGQITDQHENQRTDIHYKLSAPGINIFLGTGTISYQFIKSNEQCKGENTSSTHNISCYRLDALLVGANPSAIPVAEDYSGHLQFYLPQCKATANMYQKITYKNIYPNIDWVLYTRNNMLEYDFIVHPGGDVNNIKIKYRGAASLAKTKSGKVIAVTPYGSVTETVPLCFEAGSHKQVVSRTVLKNGTLTFKTGSYTGQLIIDPVLSWATYYGGTAAESITAITNDDSNNIYVTGWTWSANNIATTGAYQTVFQGIGATDGFISKFTGSGTLVWGTYFGGTGYDEPADITYDHHGHIIAAGNTQSTAGIATTGAHQTTLGGYNDGFIAKFNTNGILDWATYYGGNGNDDIFSIDCDSNGNIIVAGNTKSDSNIATTGSFKDTLSGTPLTGDPDAFLAKFDTAGTLQWGTYYGGYSLDDIEKVHYDGMGNIYVVGGTSSQQGIATIGSYIPTPSGGDIFLSKFNSNGFLLWGRYFSGNQYNVATSFAMNNFGELFITGQAESTNLSTPGAYQPAFTGNRSNFLFCFDTSGAEKWCTYYGSNDQQSVTPGALAVTCDKAGNAYITGGTFCQSDIATPNAYSTYPPSAMNSLFLGEFNRNGRLKYGTYLGYNPITTGNSIIIDNVGDIVIGGMTSQTTAIATPGSYQSTYGGGAFDGLILKFGADTNVYISPAFTDTLFCSDTVINIPYDVTKSFLSNNIFTAQLSDASGSFANPVATATLAATSAGVIPINLPQNMTAGSNYKVRIIASAPADTSISTSRITIATNITPSVSITMSPQNYISGQSVTFTAVVTNGGVNPQYQWFKNNVTIPGATNHQYITSNTSIGDIIKVVVHSAAVCALPDSAVAVTAPLSIAALSTSQQFSLYPNPVNNIARITWNEVKNGIVKVTDAMGKNVIEQPLKTLSGMQEINMTDLSPGIYFYQLISNNEVVTKGKFVKD